MADAYKSPRLGCGTMVLVGMLALLVVVAMQSQPRPPSWEATGAAALAVIAVFLIGRWVQNFFWGLVAGLLLLLHPSWHGLPAAQPGQVLAGAVVLAVLAGTAFAWKLAFHPLFAWRVWLPVAAVQTVGTGLAWNADPYLGLVSLVLACVGLGAAVLLGARLRRREPAALPSRLNLGTAGVIWLLLPVASLVVYRFFDRSLYSNPQWWPLIRDAFPASLEGSHRGVTLEELDAWLWPHPWAVLPVLALALVLSLRRGWQAWRRHQPPAAWLLTLAGLVLLAALLVLPIPPPPGFPLLLTALTVQLAVFLAGDLLRQMFDRLVLLPPEERAQASPTTRN